MIIAVFSYFSEELLSSSPDEINELLKTGLRNRLSQLNGDDLLAQAKSIYLKRALERPLL
jgi:hypothetical protein